MTERACFALSFSPWWEKVQHSSRFLTVAFRLDLKELSPRSDTFIRALLFYATCVCTSFAMLFVTQRLSQWAKKIQFSSVAQLSPTLCDPMNCSTPGLPCPSPTPRVHSNSRPSSPWCHPAISSSVIPFSSCPQSLPACGFSCFTCVQLFAIP